VPDHTNWPGTILYCPQFVRSRMLATNGLISSKASLLMSLEYLFLPPRLTAYTWRTTGSLYAAGLISKISMADISIVTALNSLSIHSIFSVPLFQRFNELLPKARNSHR